MSGERSSPCPATAAPRAVPNRLTDPAASPSLRQAVDDRRTTREPWHHQITFGPRPQPACARAVDAADQEPELLLVLMVRPPKPCARASPCPRARAFESPLPPRPRGPPAAGTSPEMSASPPRSSPSHALSPSSSPLLLSFPVADRHGRHRPKLPLLCPSFVSGPDAGDPYSLGCGAAMDRSGRRSLSSPSSMPRSGHFHCSSRALPSPTAAQPCRTRRFNSRCLGRQLPCPMPLMGFLAASSSTPWGRSAGPRQVRCPRPPLRALSSPATTIGLRVCRCL